GRQEEQPSGVVQCSSCMTSGISLSSFSRIRRRTSSCVKLVHLHMVFGPLSTASPSDIASRLSTRLVQLPQLAEALQVARTASTLFAPALMHATTCPLDTPLQPQISASSDRAATAALGSASAPPDAKACPKMSASRMSETSSPFFIRSKYQLPSAVSP